VTLRAYGDLLRLGRRVFSPSYDESEWQKYLDELGWPPSPQFQASRSKEVGVA
jgi:hypothetical protein